MSNSLDPDQARRFVEPDLGPNCLPRLSADDTGRQRVKPLIQLFSCRMFETFTFFSLNFCMTLIFFKFDNCGLSQKSKASDEKHELSGKMRKSESNACGNKDADQLCCSCTADQCFCFHDSAIPLLP